MKANGRKMSKQKTANVEVERMHERVASKQHVRLIKLVHETLRMTAVDSKCKQKTQTGRGEDGANHEWRRKANEDVDF